MQEAIDLAVKNVRAGRGGPFGALVVKDGEIIARATNRVTSINDPTAHAEIMAIRKACERLGHFELSGCMLYANCEPCPMCLGAIYWARLDRVYYASTREDAAAVGFDDEHIYRELDRPPSERKIPMENMMREEAHRAFNAWVKTDDRMEY